MSSTPAAIGQVVGATESHYRWVKSRILQLNSKRTVNPLMDATQWPPKQFSPNTFYALDGEIIGGHFGTPSALGMSTAVQWVWLATGEDLAPNQRGLNRGDRYRVNQQMISELIFGLFPYFCPKLAWSATDQGGTAVALGFQPISPPENIWWSYPKFSRARTADEQKVGIVYSVATVGLNQFGDTISS